VALKRVRAKEPAMSPSVVRLRPESRGVTETLVSFLAIVLTALALVPSGAHLFALPNKIGLEQNQYFIVQNMYRGWALFGVVLIPAALANFASAFVRRGQGTPFWLALAAGVLIVLTLVVFFTFIFPGNQATNNWTAAPENWPMLRERWEYGHAINALITFVALCCSTLAALAPRE
jgi:hypothetical protein